MFFLKPNSFAWKFTSTNTYTIIVSKDKAQTNENGFIEEYNLNRNTDFKFINEIFSAYYNGNLFYSKAYKTSQYKDNFTYLIRLIPLKDNTYNNIELLINKIDLGLVEIRLNKADNSVISYTFNHRIINGVIDEGTFTFEWVFFLNLAYNNITIIFMYKYILSVLVILSFLLGSCTKEELQYQDKSKKLFTYFVSTTGNEAIITYKDKSGINSFTQKDETWHTTFEVARGDTVFIRISTVNSCTVNFYSAFDGKKQFYLTNHFLPPNNQTEVAYIINY